MTKSSPEPSDRERLVRICWYIPSSYHQRLTEMSMDGTSISEHVRKAILIAERKGLSKLTCVEGEDSDKRTYWITRRQREWIKVKALEFGCDEVQILKLVFELYLGEEEGER